jgi:hypothetical protein
MMPPQCDGRSPLTVHPLGPDDRPSAEALLAERRASTLVVHRGRAPDLLRLSRSVARRTAQPIGLGTQRREGNVGTARLGAEAA